MVKELYKTLLFSKYMLKMNNVIMIVHKIFKRFKMAFYIHGLFNESKIINPLSKAISYNTINPCIKTAVSTNQPTYLQKSF